VTTGPGRRGDAVRSDLATLVDLDDAAVDRAAVAATLPVVRPFVRTTPVVRIDRAELDLPPGPLVLKLEHLQHAGSFKARGAFANLLLRSVPPAGVVAASGGNHGAAVAYAASRLDVAATIFVPEVSSPAKLARIESYGAKLVVGGADYDDARAAAAAWSARTGALDVPAFDAVATILGAGSVALELQDQAPDVQTVLASVGGGGLIAGITAAYADPETPRGVAVVGVEPEGAPTLSAAFAAGHPAEAPVGSIAIDSLAPRRVGVHTYAVIARHGTGVRLVADDAVARAQRLLWDRLRLVLEPGACVALSALLSDRYRPAPDEVVALVLSGANTTAVDFSR
jgi:threonine dehydratase